MVDNQNKTMSSFNYNAKYTPINNCNQTFISHYEEQLLTPQKAVAPSPLLLALIEEEVFWLWLTMSPQ